MAGHGSVRPALVATDELRGARYCAAEYLYAAHVASVCRLMCVGNSAGGESLDSVGVGRVTWGYRQLFLSDPRGRRVGRTRRLNPARNSCLEFGARGRVASPLTGSHARR